MEIDHAVVEATLVEQFEREADCGERCLAAADHNGREEQVAFVDESGPERRTASIAPPTARSLSASAFSFVIDGGSKSRSIRVRFVVAEVSVLE